MTQMLHSRRSVLKGLAGAASTACFARTFVLAQTKPEVGSLVVAPQFGIIYLPLHVIKAEKLLEKHLTKNGLPNSKVVWVQVTGGAAANEALLSGNVHIVSAGSPPLLTIWDRTHGNVKGIGCFDATALYLNTIKPSVTTLKDFTDKDRIALPAVKVSNQALVLQMACEKAFGAGQHAALDHLTVSMSHPDATAALLSGKSEITAHFGRPPFQLQQLEDPKVKKVLSSFDVLGGPTTGSSAYATATFRNENPRTYKAFVDALTEAHEFIQKNRGPSVKIYLDEEPSKLSEAIIGKMLDSPDIQHTIVPHNTLKYAEFMYQVGALRNKPSSWTDYYFPDIHGVMGS
jgi:NitT/TauT family transport system substrate-binding protein